MNEHDSLAFGAFDHGCHDIALGNSVLANSLVSPKLSVAHWRIPRVFDDFEVRLTSRLPLLTFEIFDIGPRPWIGYSSPFRFK
ncbi:hypothetical protein I8J30_32380 [Paenibacillus sp. DLE-14]|uniref:Uncharacterized protein n=1 Tax=Paenibacillus lignilyticus TaxID=1172615 RepID=A0ABS5CND7_9BACL|nr:hypothetical protein [Paenibacillus lignilyticus]MBP3967368.1 hypothetical protein [Paenibacillus lignilyticus]